MNEQSIALLAALVRSSLDAIVSKDLSSIVTSWNPAAERMFGYTSDEMIGQSILRIIPEDRAEEEAFIIESVKHGKVLEHYETLRQHKDGHLIHVSLTISPIRSEEGEIVGVSKIARDISERRMAEETRRLLMREVNHRSKNLLAVIEAIVRQTASRTPANRLVPRISARLQALSRGQDLLVKNEWRGIPFDELVWSQMPYLDVDSERRIVVDGPAIMLTPVAAQAVGMALHELASNAQEHGALSDTTGQVAVQWGLSGSLREPTLSLNWTESGGPFVLPAPQAGFGRTILERVTPTSLNGTAICEYSPDGMSWQLKAPAQANVVGYSQAPVFGNTF
jgi:PAS domain S-box-containing protein